ncbi:MAG: FAD-dependent oxidoreductase [Endomicrobium sp.]|jgi:NAD(P)H-nitrite reductase large subunit|nr:FAD-dependent oxidoreductase [Endomicrobium sp.]
MKYLIIGNSAAGVNAIEAIRRLDQQNNITVISEENYQIYGRPLISYYLSGKIKYKNMFSYKEKDFYTKKKANLLLNTKVNSINTKIKKIYTNDNLSLEYDKLLLATGSLPFIPCIKGLKQHIDNKKDSNVFTFLTFEDSLRLKNKIKKTSKVVVLGAGLIGLKVVEGLSGQVDNITVIDLSDRIMASVLNEIEANMVKSHIEKCGDNVFFKLKTGISEVRNDTLLLSNNTVIDYDILIVSVGVKPNVELAKNAGLKIGKGIIVNNYLQTSNKDVYAAGDCIEYEDLFSNNKKLYALWTNATRQGELAGYNMSGIKMKYSRYFAINAISFFGMNLLSAGITTGKDIHNYIIESSINTFHMISILNNKLVGFVLINCPNKRAGIYTTLINDGIDISTLDYDITTMKNIKFSIYPKKNRTKKMWQGAA